MPSLQQWCAGPVWLHKYNDADAVFVCLGGIECVFGGSHGRLARFLYGIAGGIPARDAPIRARSTRACNFDIAGLC